MLDCVGNISNLASQKKKIAHTNIEKCTFFTHIFNKETIKNLSISVNKNLICFFIFGKESTFGRFFKLI